MGILSSQPLADRVPHIVCVSVQPIC